MNMILPKIKRTIKKLLFYKKYKFFPPPFFTDMSGYEGLMDTITQKGLYKLEGDFVEIGTFLGGGTYKLSMLLKKLKSDKTIYAIDIFSPSFDTTTCTKGKTMAALYKKRLKGKKQRDIYNETIKNCQNIVTIAQDSKKVTLPTQKIAFAFIDGNHTPKYIKNDFHLVWEKLVPKGVVAFDDYGYDLPQVTKTIHEIIRNRKNEIFKIWTKGQKTIFIQKL